MSERPVIHWFRGDLRLSDNTALQAAFDRGLPVLPLFIVDPVIVNSPYFGLPRMALLVRALESLDRDLQARGSRLMIRQGSPVAVLHQVAEQTNAQAVYFNRDYTPYARRRDAEAADSLAVNVRSFDDAILLPPGAVMKADGNPYTVFTPFLRQWKQHPKPHLTSGENGSFYAVEAPDWWPDYHWNGALPEASEWAAQARLADFARGPIFTYGDTRNLLTPDPFEQTDTSGLSPYLRFGLLSPRQAYWAAREAYTQAETDQTRCSVETWVNELAWREFYVHILAHFPHVLRGSFRPQYNRLNWRDAPDDFAAWKEGRTGFPVVDAAMRQLKAVGWMPNRARMIVASFLTKDLLIDWRKGERHFMHWLIDGDLASNNGGWQWAAGTGTDAQPYFRIFNPVMQSKKYDPTGAYIRRWVPELDNVPDRYLHEPWKMDHPPADYPAPIVNHDTVRQRALAAYKAVESDRL